MKRLKHVEDINKKQLEKQLKPFENTIDNANRKAFKKLKFLIYKAKEALDDIKELDKKIDYTKLVCMHANGKIFLTLTFLED